MPHRATLIVRLHEVCENLGRRFSALNNHAIRQIELVVRWILCHEAVPVALVQRVHVLIYDGLRGRRFFNGGSFMSSVNAIDDPRGNARRTTATSLHIAFPPVGACSASVVERRLES